MIRFTILDSIDLRASDGTALTPVLAQPKRVALLAYLCLAGRRGFVRRDTLLALLWPDAPTDRARNALRQAVHQLRRSLGEEAVPGRGLEELGIAVEHLWCDALAFEELLGQGRPEEALALYHGDLAHGLYVGDAPGFTEWIEGERLRLQRLALRAAEQLSDQASGSGDPARAVEWARRAVAMSPLEEEPVQRLMSVLDRQGDRGGALAAYEGLAERLSRELDATPSAETLALARSIRTRVEPYHLGEEAGGRAGHAPQAPPPSPAGSERIPAATPPRSRWMVALAIAGLLVVGAVWPFMAPSRSAGAHPDPRLLVVTPFRVGGADAGLTYLREGMLDLLATKFASGSTLVAADPRAVLAMWRQMSGDSLTDLPPQDAVRVARRLGAGRVLLGAVIGTPDRLTLSARLLDDTGAPRATAEVVGPADSLPELIDRMAAELLIGESGEPPQRLADLASASLPALQAYLAGRDAYRRGAYQDAVRHLRTATTLDSSFALAWLRLADAEDWADVGSGPRDAPGRAVALRSRLSDRDAAYLDALLGPKYPAPRTQAERLAAWEHVVQLSPDLAEGWYGLGDVLFHFGRSLQADSNLRRAEAAFARARALDSAYAAPLTHLLQISIARGDRPAIVRDARQLAAIDATGDLQEFFRWRVALALGDSAAVARERARFGTIGSTTLTRIATWSQLEGVGVGDGLLASRVMMERATTEDQRRNATSLRLLLAGNAGQFTEFDHAYAASVRLSGQRPWPSQAISNALYWDADTARGSAAVRSREFRSAAAADNVLALIDLVWRVQSGIPVDSAQLRSTLAASRADPQFQGARKILHLELEALVASSGGEPGSAVATQQLAGEMERQGTFQQLTEAQLVLARCYERLGNPRAALEAVQRRPVDQWTGLAFLSTYLRLEGRYAAMVGDTAAAVRAYRHYLALRAFADPEVQGRVAEVRAALAALEGPQVASTASH